MENIEDIIGSPIIGIYSEKFSSETTGYTSIVIQIPNYYLQFTVNDETDEIIFKTKKDLDIGILNKYLYSDKFEGTVVMQIWGLENEKGYSDLICLGLEELVPTILFTVIASEIKIGFVNYELS